MRDTLHTGSSVVVVSSNRTLPFLVLTALLAGMIALAANIALLSIASAAGIRAAHGGLFLLFTKIIHRVAPSRSFMDSWKIFAPPVSQAVFHIVTGLMMAIFYTLGLLDPIQIATVGLAPSQYQVYLADLEHAPFGRLEPLAILRTNPDGAGIVQTVGPLKESLRWYCDGCSHGIAKIPDRD
jgi:hypothetical protein